MLDRLPIALLSFSALTLVACGPDALPAPEADETVELENGLATQYGDLLVTLPEADLEKWIATRSALKQGFDHICGDTICGGDYPNLATVTLNCSSTTVARKLKACTWTLGGSWAYVNGSTGKINTDARFFSCPVGVNSNAKTMLDALTGAGTDALNTPVPGTGGSFYDALTTCFEKVRGAPVPAYVHAYYARLDEYLWEGNGDAEAWDTITRQLNVGFDEICGDTFCEGEYSSYAPLGFTCSVNRNTKRVARCAWAFAAANAEVGKKGKIDVQSQIRICNIEVGASAEALIAALKDDPLTAVLPGKSTSIYDALSSCL